MEKEINIVAPEGYEIDKENSTFECIKFKPIEKKRWRGNEEEIITGCYIDTFSEIIPTIVQNTSSSYNVFVTRKQAKSALAMARISQIMANDERFGGVITDEEWDNPNLFKYVIVRVVEEQDRIYCTLYKRIYHFLAFHTAEQRDLFLEENEDLVRDYLMID